VKIKTIRILQPVDQIMSHSINPRLVHGLPTPTIESHSTTDRVVYEKNATVRVEDMGDGHFRDVDRNQDLYLEDKSTYQFEDEV
jgi:hypothetical protein